MNPIGTILVWVDILLPTRFWKDPKKDIGDRRGEGVDLGNIGIVYDDLGQYEKALAFYQQALAIRKDIGDRRGEGKNLNNIGVLYQTLKHYDKALTSLRKSQALFESLGALDDLRESQHGLAETFLSLGRVNEAISQYDHSLNTLEQLLAYFSQKHLRSSYVQDKFSVYDDYIETLNSLHRKSPKKGYDQKAMEVFERKQGRLFLAHIGQSGARHFSGLPDTLRQQEQNLMQEQKQIQQALGALAAQANPDLSQQQTLNGKLTTVSQAFDAFKKRLKKQHPAYYDIRYPQPVKLPALQQHWLKPGESILAYQVLAEKTFVWVINQTHIHFEALPIREADLKNLVAYYRQDFTPKAKDINRKGIDRFIATVKLCKARCSLKAVSKRTQSTLTKTGRELYKALLPTYIQQALRSTQQLYIIPTGILYSLPFEALVVTPADTAPRYLIEDYPVTYLSSASALKSLRESNQNRRQATTVTRVCGPGLWHTNQPTERNGCLLRHAGRRSIPTTARKRGRCGLSENTVSSARQCPMAASRRNPAKSAGPEPQRAAESSAAGGVLRAWRITPRTGCD